MNVCSRRNQQALNWPMPRARSKPELHLPRVSLHIGASPEAAWENVVRDWFERIATGALQDNKPAVVVTASRSQAYFFRSRLLTQGKSLLGVKFLAPRSCGNYCFKAVTCTCRCASIFVSSSPSLPK